MITVIIVDKTNNTNNVIDQADLPIPPFVGMKLEWGDKHIYKITGITWKYPKRMLFAEVKKI